MTQPSGRTLAEQTNRSSDWFGERGSSHKRPPWRYGCGARPVRRPVSGVGRWNGSLLGCFRKDLVLVSHCALGFGGVRVIL